MQILLVSWSYIKVNLQYHKRLRSNVGSMLGRHGIVWTNIDPIFKELNRLKINDIYRLQLLKCYFKYQHNSLLKYFDVFNLRLNSEIHAHNTKNQHKLRIPFVKQNLDRACVRYQLPKTVNTMPRSITDKEHTHSFNGFSTYVKIIFLDTYTTDCKITNCYVCSIYLN